MRDTYKYELWHGRHLVFVGITTDLLRSRYEQSRSKEFTKMRVIGRVTTRAAALAWKQKRIEIYRKNHKGTYPPYNVPPFGDE